jgi:hypothetical protein
MKTFVDLRNRIDTVKKAETSGAGALILTVVATYIVRKSVAVDLPAFNCGEDSYSYGPPCELTFNECRSVLSRSLARFNAEPIMLIMVVECLDRLQVAIQAPGYPLTPSTWRLILYAVCNISASLAFDLDLADCFAEKSLSFGLLAKAVLALSKLVELNNSISRATAFRAYALLHEIAIKAEEKAAFKTIDVEL